MSGPTPPGCEPGWQRSRPASARALLKDVVFPWLGTATGTVLILFSAFCFAAAVWREMGAGAPPPRPDIKRLPAALLLGVNGFLILVSLAALVGIWSARS